MGGTSTIEEAVSPEEKPFRAASDMALLVDTFLDGGAIEEPMSCGHVSDHTQSSIALCHERNDGRIIYGADAQRSKACLNDTSPNVGAELRHDQVVVARCAGEAMITSRQCRTGVRSPVPPPAWADSFSRDLEKWSLNARRRPMERITFEEQRFRIWENLHQRRRATRLPRSSGQPVLA
jgi:hypothetical protein